MQDEPGHWWHVVMLVVSLGAVWALVAWLYGQTQAGR